VKYKQVERKHDQYKHNKSDPKTNSDFHNDVR